MSPVSTLATPASAPHRLSSLPKPGAFPRGFPTASSSRGSGSPAPPQRRPGKTVVEAGAPPHGPRPSTAGRTWSRTGRLRVRDNRARGGPRTRAPPPGRRRVHHPAESPSRADDEHRARRTQTDRRTHARTHAHAAPRSHDGACREREGARPSPARPAFPLLRTLCSRHLRPSAPASRLRPRPSRQRGSRPRSCLFKWWGQRAAPAAAAWVAPRAAIEGRTKMAAALAL